MKKQFVKLVFRFIYLGLSMLNYVLYIENEYNHKLFSVGMYQTKLIYDINIY